MPDVCFVRRPWQTFPSVIAPTTPFSRKTTVTSFEWQAVTNSAATTLYQ